MRKSTYILLITIIGSLFIIVSVSKGQGFNDLDIDIISSDDSISVVESISLNTLELTDTFYFWIQDGISDISVIISDETYDYTLVDTNTYSINISELLPFEGELLNIEISYELIKDTNLFEKTLLFDISALIIDFNGKELYSANNLNIGNTLNIALQKTPQPQIIIEKKTIDTIPTWIYIVIIVLIILLFASFMRPAKKQKSPKIKETVAASEELLTTKKLLLMSLLKDIEKQHRSKEISDNTYHKLKERYKEEAVEAMKQLEDMKSKAR